MKRETVFVVQITWLLFLIVTAVYFFRTMSGREVNFGSIPIGVLWFGALGAILISLTGVVEHSPVKGPVAGQVPLRILGSGFTGTSAVSFGSVNATFTVDSDGQISLTLPPAAAVGPVSVTVKTKVGSASAPFDYT
jgi:hypothetical protein